MKKNYFFIILVTLISSLSFGQNVFISEINYLGTGTQQVEITGPAGTNVGNWQLIFRGNTSRNVYYTFTIPASTTIDNEIGGYGALAFTMASDIRDTANSGVELVNSSGNLIAGQFLSWSGTFTGKGATNGVTSSSIGTQTNSSQSMQLDNTGWIEGSPSFGTLNSNLTLSVTKNQIEDFNIYPNPVRNGRISISTKNSFEKNVVIYSILGSVVYNKTVGPNEVINVQNLSTGMYLVQVEEDEKVSVRKLLIN